MGTRNILCAAGLLLSPTALHAEEGKPAVTHLTAAQLMGVAAKAEAIGKVSDAELIYQTLSRDQNIDVRNEARFRWAAVKQRGGSFAAAASLYRAILDEKPDALRVRLELAAILARMGDLSAAGRELRQAQAGNLPPQIAQIVDQYAIALRSFKPWGGSLELALAPDTNVNRATDAKSLDTVIAPLTLSDDARQQSGIGIKASGQLYARASIFRNLSLVPRLSGQGLFYKESRFNDRSGSAQLDIEWRIKTDRLTLSLGRTWRWYGDALYAKTQSTTADWQRPVGRRSQLSVSFGINRLQYSLNQFQDGAIYNAGLTAERALTVRSGVSISLFGSRQTARDPGYATRSGGISLTYWHGIGRTAIFGNVTISRLVGDQRLFLFTDRRKERFYRVGAGATFRHVQFAGFAPIVRFGYERNSSSVGIYDYSRVSGDIGITRAF